MQRESLWALARRTGRWWAYPLAVLVWPLELFSNAADELHRTLPATTRFIVAVIAVWAALRLWHACG